MRITRIVVARLGAVASLVCLQSSMALAGDVVTLRCDFPEQNGIQSHYSEIIADTKGISVTDYKINKETNKLQYIKAYTENKKEENKETFYRINTAEIAWGSEYKLFGTTVNTDSTIDLRSEVEKDNVVMTDKDGVHERPTEIGHCKPN